MGKTKQYPKQDIQFDEVDVLKETCKDYAWETSIETFSGIRPAAYSINATEGDGKLYIVGDCNTFVERVEGFNYDVPAQPHVFSVCPALEVLAREALESGSSLKQWVNDKKSLPIYLRLNEHRRNDTGLLLSTNEWYLCREKHDALFYNSGENYICSAFTTPFAAPGNVSGHWNPKELVEKPPTRRVFRRSGEHSAPKPSLKGRPKTSSKASPKQRSKAKSRPSSAASSADISNITPEKRSTSRLSAGRLSANSRPSGRLSTGRTGLSEQSSSRTLVKEEYDDIKKEPPPEPPSHEKSHKKKWKKNSKQSSTSQSSPALGRRRSTRLESRAESRKLLTTESEEVHESSVSQRDSSTSDSEDGDTLVSSDDIPAKEDSLEEKMPLKKPVKPRSRMTIKLRRALTRPECRRKIKRDFKAVEDTIESYMKSALNMDLPFPKEPNIPPVAVQDCSSGKPKSDDTCARVLYVSVHTNERLSSIISIQRMPMCKHEKCLKLTFGAPYQYLVNYSVRHCHYIDSSRMPHLGIGGVLLLQHDLGFILVGIPVVVYDDQFSLPDWYPTPISPLYKASIEELPIIYEYKCKSNIIISAAAKIIYPRGEVLSTKYQGNRDIAPLGYATRPNQMETLIYSSDATIHNDTVSPSYKSVRVYSRKDVIELKVVVGTMEGCLGLLQFDAAGKCHEYLTYGHPDADCYRILSKALSLSWCPDVSSTLISVGRASGKVQIFDVSSLYDGPCTEFDSLSRCTSVVRWSDVSRFILAATAMGSLFNVENSETTHHYVHKDLTTIGSATCSSAVSKTSEQNWLEVAQKDILDVSFDAIIKGNVTTNSRSVLVQLEDSEIKEGFMIGDIDGMATLEFHGSKYMVISTSSNDSSVNFIRNMALKYANHGLLIPSSASMEKRSVATDSADGFAAFAYDDGTAVTGKILDFERKQYQDVTPIMSSMVPACFKRPSSNAIAIEILCEHSTAATLKDRYLRELDRLEHLGCSKWLDVHDDGEKIILKRTERISYDLYLEKEVPRNIPKSEDTDLIFPEILHNKEMLGGFMARYALWGGPNPIEYPSGGPLCITDIIFSRGNTGATTWRSFGMKGGLVMFIR